MRMFVAVDLDDSTKAAIAREQQMAWRLAAKAPIKFVNPEKAHLTLAFLADVPSLQCDRLIDAMHQPVEGIGPFQMTFGGLGVFPPRGAPRVLWLPALAGQRPPLPPHRTVGWL